jgi:hypothetical protein
LWAPGCGLFALRPSWAGACGLGSRVRWMRACGRSVVVARKPSKLQGRVQFPSPACLPRGVAQSGSAPGWGPGGRRFKSCLPDLRIAWNSALFLPIADCEEAGGEQTGNKILARYACVLPPAVGLLTTSGGFRVARGADGSGVVGSDSIAHPYEVAANLKLLALPRENNRLEKLLGYVVGGGCCGRWREL